MYTYRFQIMSDIANHMSHLRCMVGVSVSFVFFQQLFQISLMKNFEDEAELLQE
jgi:hypothetical protein